MPLRHLLDDEDIFGCLAEQLTLRHIGQAAVCHLGADRVRKKREEWKVFMHERTCEEPHTEKEIHFHVPPDRSAHAPALSRLPDGTLSYIKPNGYRDSFVPVRVVLGHDEPHASDPDFVNEFVNPHGVIITNSYIYTACGRVVEKAHVKDGVVVASRSIVGPGESDDESMTSGAALSPDGRSLFVVDAGLHRIVEFTSQSLVRVRAFGRNGHGPGELSFPEGLCTYVSGCGASRLFVADCFNHRINVTARSGLEHAALDDTDSARFRSHTSPLTLGTSCPLPPFACVPTPQVYDLGESPPRFLCSIGRHGREAGEFELPCDVAISRERLLVSEERRVQVLTIDGAPLQVLTMPHPALLGMCTLSVRGHRVFVRDGHARTIHILFANGTPFAMEHPSTDNLTAADTATGSTVRLRGGSQEEDEVDAWTDFITMY